MRRNRKGKNMIVGTSIIHPGSATAYYSPSFPRGGEAANFSLDTTQVSGSPTLGILVEHKNYDEVTWGTAGTFTSITTTGVSTLDVTGIKEELRLKYAFSAGSAGDLVHLVVAAPAWRPY